MAKNICPNCGKENKDGSKFCAVCGAPLAAAPEEPVTANGQAPTGGDAQPEMPETPRKGFFHRPAGIVVIIVVIAAAAIVAVFITLHVRAVRQSAQAGEEALLSEETAALETEEAEEEEETPRETVAEEPTVTAEEEETETEEETEAEEAGAEEEEEAETDGTAESVCTFVPFDESYECDLDGDGENETVSFTFDSEKERAWVYVDEQGLLAYDWGFPAEEFCIVDIYPNDNTMEIALSYTSDDDAVNTVFYSYEYPYVYKLGEIPGGFSGSEPFPDIVVPGDGTVISYKALDVFETWFAEAVWFLSPAAEEGLVEVEPDVYEPLDLFDGLGIDLTTLQEIDAYVGDPDYGEQIILPAGTKVHLTGTDNEDWVSMTADGYEDTLYLWLCEDGTCVYRPHTNEPVAVYEVFDNLSQFG